MCVLGCPVCVDIHHSLVIILTKGVTSEGMVVILHVCAFVLPAFHSGYCYFFAHTQEISDLLGSWHKLFALDGIFLCFSQKQQKPVVHQHNMLQKLYTHIV